MTVILGSYFATPDFDSKFLDESAPRFTLLQSQGSIVTFYLYSHF